jgi:hypothetical protein
MSSFIDFPSPEGDCISVHDARNNTWSTDAIGNRAQAALSVLMIQPPEWLDHQGKLSNPANGFMCRNHKGYFGIGASGRRL